MWVATILVLMTGTGVGDLVSEIRTGPFPSVDFCIGYIEGMASEQEPNWKIEMAVCASDEGEYVYRKPGQEL
jgi:hypothetical protein